MISELVYTPPLNGIYTTFGLFLATVYVPLCERILFKLRMVYIPVYWTYESGIYTTFGLILAMVYVPRYERILFKLRVVYIPVTEQTSW